MTFSLTEQLQLALAQRLPALDERHETALRLFNGFTEGLPALAVDLYARTLVLHDYAEITVEAGELIEAAAAFYQAQLPWLQCIVVKRRNTEDAQLRKGTILVGAAPDRKVREAGVWYALEVLLNRDASLYLDTRNLREWLRGHARGQRVLNTFAYTGSLGVAALAGGAAQVVQLDLNRAFLNVAKTSYTLNGFPIQKADFLAGDFWPLVSRLNRASERFDCVLLDPPFFASTTHGMVDVAHNYERLINKVRPLTNDGGCLIAVNNGLFVSGAEYQKMLQRLCVDGYLTIEELIPVTEDFTGYPATRVAAVTGVPDSAPFNHATKIAVLRVRRKDAQINLLTS